jgi:signal transduction histidine kinase
MDVASKPRLPGQKSTAKLGSPDVTPVTSATALKAGSRTDSMRFRLVNRKWLIGAGFALAAAILFLVGAVSFQSAQTAQQRALSVAHTHEVMQSIQEVLTLMTDAETGQRGFLVTGRDEYLEPFVRAKARLPQALERLRGLTADNPEQRVRLGRMERYGNDKLALLALTPGLRTDVDKLREAIQGGAGKRVMDLFRAEIASMTRAEQALLEQRGRESEESAAFTKQITIAGFALSLALIGVSYLMLRQEGEERARAEAQVHALNSRLARRATQLEVSNRELEGFSYSVSHDLRIPLRAVSGYAQIMEEDYGAGLDGEGRRLLALVRGNANMMNTLIDDLLTFSRLGNKALKKSEIDMEQLARAAVQQCASAEAAGQASSEAAPREIRIGRLPNAPGDAALLRQVWTNLIANAIKYSAARSPAHIEVSGDVQGDEAVYHVRDNGVGFDMRYAHKLFGVFQRLHGVDEYPGTGVGLAIVQRVVMRHGGRVWADAKPEQGATFSFTLPLAATEPGEDDARPAGD